MTFRILITSRLIASRVIAAGAVSLLAVASLSAQNAAAPKPGAAKAGAIPRAADGHPDLTGIWSNATRTPFERPADFGGKATLTDQEAKDWEATENKRWEEGSTLWSEPQK